MWYNLFFVKMFLCQEKPKNGNGNKAPCETPVLPGFFISPDLCLSLAGGFILESRRFFLESRRRIFNKTHIDSVHGRMLKIALRRSWKKQISVLTMIRTDDN